MLDYQNLKKDSNRLFTSNRINSAQWTDTENIWFRKNRSIAQKDIYSLRKGNRSVFVNNEEYPLLCYKDCEPLPNPNRRDKHAVWILPARGNRLIAKHGTEFKETLRPGKRICQRASVSEHRAKADLKRSIERTAHIIENYRNELYHRHAHEQENRTRLMNCRQALWPPARDCLQGVWWTIAQSHYQTRRIGYDIRQYSVYASLLARVLFAVCPMGVLPWNGRSFGYKVLHFLKNSAYPLSMRYNMVDSM